MYDKDFFPTPKNVADLMLSGLDFKHDKTFLDPSAGEGDLLDVIAGKRKYSYGYGRSDGKDGLYAIEIDTGRQAILRDKDYKVIDTDFLLYSGLQFFDYMLINPPFDDGASHLLHAWDNANGATIRCLLNSETLKNAHTQERKRLKQIIERYGWAKELGQAFKSAERKTDVFVTLVHLHDSRKGEPFRLDFEPKKLNGRFRIDDTLDGSLITTNVFAAYEARYNAGIEAFKKLLLARQEVNFFLAPLMGEYKNVNNLTADALKNSQGPEVAYKTFLDDVTKEAWDSLFRKTKLASVTTEAVQRNLEEAQAQQGKMAYTAANMEALFNQLFASRERIMVDCVVDSFQELTRWYKDNREHISGFKSNSAYKVSTRFILPNMGATYSEGLDYIAKRKVSDLEKSLCFIAGKKFEDIMSVAEIYDRKSYHGEKMESEFLFTRFYKNGNLHCWWKDEDLRQRFNIIAAKEMWGFDLPERTKKGAYE